MANNKNTFEEVLRFIIEAEGDTDIARLAKQILSLDEASQEARESTAALLDTYAKSQGLGRAADEFRRLGTEVVELQRSFTEIQGKVKAAAQEIESTEEPTKKQEATLAKLRKQLQDTASELESSQAKWRQQKQVLEAAGVSTARYSTIERQVADAQRAATNALKEHAVGLLRVRQNATDYATRLDRLGRSTRDQGRETLNAAADLKEYERRAEAAKRKTKELGDEVRESSGVMSTLKTVAASVFAFFSVDRLITGIKSIATEGSKGEQELAQLEAALASTGRQAEFTGEQLDDMADSVARGLFDKGDITNAQTRLLTYTNIVGEMFPRALQVSIDQAQRLGISVESSTELIGRALQTPSKAMEALGRQGFVLEDSQKALIKTLEATGRTAEAQAIIMDLLVESYGGAAAAAQTNTILGLWERLRETWRDWQQDVANRGVLNYFKDQIRQILDTTKRLADDGTLGRWAQQTADALVRLAEFLKATTRTLFEHRDAILLAAKAYAAFKIGGALVQMNQWRIALMAASREALANAAAMRGVGARATQLGTILRALPTSLTIGVALMGVETVRTIIVEGQKAVGKWLEQHGEVARIEREIQQQFLDSATRYKQSAEQLQGYSGAAVLAAADIAKLSEAERAAYAERADGLQRYLVSLSMYYQSMSDAGALTPTLREQWDEVSRRLMEVNRGVGQIAAGAKLAADALRNDVTPAAQLVLEKLDAVARGGRAGREQLRELFANLDFRDSGSLDAVALAIGKIAGESAAAERAVRDGLAAELDALAGEDLLRFQSAATAAFAAFRTEPAQVAAVLDSTLLVSLSKLGVSAERTGLAFTKTSRDAVAAFSAIAENARATGDQIEIAFRSALGRVASAEDAQALGAALRAAGEQGRIGFEASERAAAALAGRLRQIQVAMDPLADEFAALGIQSQASLEQARESARSSFEAIRKAAAQGKASIEDVRRAYQAYARTARDSVADSDSYVRRRVEGELEVLDAVLDVNRGMGDMAAQGRAAGEQVAAGANTATDALNQTAAAAERGRQAMLGGSDATDKMGDSAKKASAETQSLSFSIGELSEKAWDMLRNEVFQTQDPLGAFGGFLRGLTEQRKQFAALEEDLNNTAKAYDELADRRRELQSKFELIGEGDINRLLQVEQGIEQAQDARRQKAAQAAEEQRRADEARLQAANQLRDATAEASTPVAASDNKLTVELVYPEPSSGGELSPQQRREADKLLRYLLPRIVQELTRLRSVAIQQRPRR